MGFYLASAQCCNMNEKALLSHILLEPSLLSLIHPDNFRVWIFKQRDTLYEIKTTWRAHESVFFHFEIESKYFVLEYLGIRNVTFQRSYKHLQNW